LQIIRELIKGGADLDQQNSVADTALIYAARYNQLDIVRELIEAGANIDMLNAYRNTALSVAYCEKYWEVFHELLNRGADVNIRYHGNDTLLIMACQLKDLSTVQKLIRLGSNVNAQNNIGHTALISCVSDKDFHLGDENPFNGKTFHSNGDNCKELAIVKELINAGAYLNLQCHYTKTTALMHASYNNKLEIVQRLIESGSDLDIQDCCCRTALMIASANNCSEIVKELINAGAKLDIQNDDNYTALMESVLHPDNIQVTSLLIQAGAALQNLDESALLLAIRYNEIELIL